MYLLTEWHPWDMEQMVEVYKDKTEAQDAYNHAAKFMKMIYAEGEGDVSGWYNAPEEGLREDGQSIEMENDEGTWYVRLIEDVSVGDNITL